jgi:hypothetical protein
VKSNIANPRPAPKRPKLTAEIGDVVDRVVGKTDTLHPSLVATLETVIPKEIGPKRKSETSPLVDKPDLEEKALKELSQPRGLTHSSPYGSI